ncbi:MAG TPA: VWA domain-containing protein [Candidatus Acidoferrum sp.]|nr:VWA domain-containing protein [Candidatus Acidoferrum sp.]
MTTIRSNHRKPCGPALCAAALLALAACGRAYAPASSTGTVAMGPPISVPQAAEAHPTVDTKQQKSIAQGAAGALAGQNLVIGGGGTWTQPPVNNERYQDVAPNPVKIAAEEPVSTFSIDVDSASYSNVRRFLHEGTLPPRDTVRIEEMVNYFDYAYDLPKERTAPFAASVAVMPTPWNPGTKLLHIGIKGYDMARTERPRANLVFLIDVSGSMQSPDKLPLVKQTVSDFVRHLDERDRVAIVVYAGNVGTVLEPTPASNQARILAAIDGLEAGGSTAGGEGIRQAYELAERNFDKAAVNRVILATDGDFNVGIIDPQALEDFVARKRETGIYLSVLGFGTGNINDLLWQKLAQSGNGNAAYIDSLMEGHKVLIDEASSTLFPIANDVKIQVEFNPAVVAEYRLIGYETRALRREDFNNDQVDAGEIGSGHEVTALYEITPVGSPARLDDPLRYGTQTAPAAADRGSEYAFLRLRYKLPGEQASRLIERPVTRSDEYAGIDRAPAEARFAVAVAAFGELLRGDPYLSQYRYDDVLALAQTARGTDEYGYRAEFVQLVRIAEGARAQAALQ